MKLIPWNIDESIEAYTITREFGDMSYTNSDYQTILQNRKNLSVYLNTDLSHMIAPWQSHTNHFKEVSLNKDGGKGMYHPCEELKDVDALYTKDKDLFLLTFHADCTPILLYAPDKQIIAAIHSGWLGTTRQIVTHVTKHLIEIEHCDPSVLKAYIGPCISQKHLEVQQDVIDKVNAMAFDTTPFYYQTDNIHFQLDNKGLNKQMLLNLGVLESNITVSPYCTVEDNDLFFSHRKNKDGKRNITIIKQKKK